MTSAVPQTLELGDVITALQVGDSQFPSGAFAFSWGLEALVRDARIARRDFAALLRAEIEDRWASFDRVFVHRAMRAQTSRLQAQIDAQIDALSWSETARSASRRAGASLLTAHVRLGTPGAAVLRASIADGQALGHLPLVQGVVFRGLGLAQPLGLALSGCGVLFGLSSAAVRLGLVGALQAQGAVSKLRPRLAELAAERPPEHAGSFNPMMDIAMMRHADHDGTLFAS